MFKIRDLKFLQISCLFMGISLLFGNQITYKEALSLAQSENLKLKGLKDEIKSKQSLENQSGYFKNPEFELNTENFGGNEIEASISQTFELGGKRKARRQIAEKVTQNKIAESEKLNLQIKANVTRSFAGVLAIQNNIVQLKEVLAVADSSLKIVNSQVKAGAANKIDAIRYEIKLAWLDLELKKKHRIYKNQLGQLEILLGKERGEITAVTGVFDFKFALPDTQKLESALNASSLIKESLLQEQLADLEIVEAKSHSLPDLQIGAGYLHNTEAGEGAPLLGFGIEIPIFNRNQGQIQEKVHLKNVRKLETKNLKLELKNSLQSSFAKIRDLRNKHEELSSTLLPKTTGAYEQILKFYQYGRTSLLDVIELQKDLVELQAIITETEFEIVETATEIQSIIDLNLNLIN